MSNENQPRIPAGQSGGGEFTYTNDSGTQPIHGPTLEMAHQNAVAKTKKGDWSPGDVLWVVTRRVSTGETIARYEKMR